MVRVGSMSAARSARSNSVSSPGIVRLNNSGAVDATFDTGLGANGTVYAVATYPTNSIYNAGKCWWAVCFTNFNGSAVGNLVRLNPDGSLDTQLQPACFDQQRGARHCDPVGWRGADRR